MIRGNCVCFSPHQIDLMRKAGRLTAMARSYAGTLIQPGITTREIDHEVEKFIKKHGGYPSFYHLYGFKGACCISVNDEIIHGVPGSYKLKEGRHRLGGRGRLHRRLSAGPQQSRHRRLSR